MCGPIAGVILGIGGAILRGIGAVKQGQAGFAAGLDDARAALLHAEITRTNTALLAENAATGRRYAGVALQRGAAQEAQVRGEVGRVSTAQQAGFAAAGIDPTRGSPLVLASLTAAQGETDAMLVRSGAIQESAQIMADAAGQAGAAYASALSEKGYLQASEAAIRRAREARMAGWFGAGTALLSGIGDIWQSNAQGAPA